MIKPGGHVRGSFCLSSLDSALLELPHGRARELPAAENPLCAECFKSCKNVLHLLKTYSGSSTVLGASKRRRRNTRAFLIADCVPSSGPSMSWSQSSLPTMARIDKRTQNLPPKQPIPTQCLLLQPPEEQQCTSALGFFPRGFCWLVTLTLFLHRGSARPGAGLLGTPLGGPGRGSSYAHMAPERLR